MAYLLMKKKIQIFKKIALPNIKTVTVDFTSTTPALVIKVYNSFAYFNFSNKVKYVLSKQLLFLMCKNQHYKKRFQFRLAFLHFQFALRNRLYKRELLIIGKGFLAEMQENAKVLFFKFGRNQMNSIRIPEYIIKATVSQNRVQAYSYCLANVAAFMKAVQKFKKPNVYTGTGLFKKYETIILKPMKRTKKGK